MTTYRIMGYIPTRAVPPAGGSAITASTADVDRGLAMAHHFPEDMAYYSDRMCDIDLSIRVLDDIIPNSVYVEALTGQHYMLARSIAQRFGEEDQYDGFFVMNPPTLTTATTFRGIGGTSSGRLFMWVKIGSDERAILVHEFGHAMTAYLSTILGTYTNFPSCAPEPAMHCNAVYGWTSDIDPGWLRAFMQAKIPDGTGISQVGWDEPTPTETGVSTLPKYREVRTPKGLSTPLRFHS